MSHLEDVPVGEPARCGRLDPLDELAPAEEEAEPSRAEEVLEHACAEEVAADRAHVDRHRAHRLVGVDQHQCPSLVRQPGDGLDVEPAAVPKTDVGHGDERGLLVDGGLEALERDRPVRLGRHVLDAHPASLLCVPDLADRRKLEVADHDLVATLAEAQPARKRAHAGRDGGRHGDLVLVRFDEARDASAHRLQLPDPVLPRRAVLVPVGEVAVVRCTDRVGECALRAAVDVDALLEDGEPVPDPRRQSVHASRLADRRHTVRIQGGV